MKMKKNKNQFVSDCSSKSWKSCDCNSKNVSSKSNNKVSGKTKNIGFKNESKSFQLDENDDHSFELR